MPKFGSSTTRLVQDALNASFPSQKSARNSIETHNDFHRWFLVFEEVLLFLISPMNSFRSESSVVELNVTYTKAHLLQGFKDVLLILSWRSNPRAILFITRQNFNLNSDQEPLTRSILQEAYLQEQRCPRRIPMTKQCLMHP